MSTPKKQTYIQLREELDTILSWFEGENIDIDEAIEKYKIAIETTKKLEQYLQTAENKIKELKRELPEV